MIKLCRVADRISVLKLLSENIATIWRPMCFRTLICLLTFATYVMAQLVSTGRCPEVKTLQFFNMIDFMGDWFEQANYRSHENFLQKCIFAKYWAGKDNIIRVHNEALLKLFNIKWEKNGTVQALAPGQLHVSFEKHSKPSTEPNLLVLGTDYKNYAVLYKCTDYTKMFHATSLWILTRQRNPKKEPVIEARKVLEENKITAKYLYDTNQADCSLQTVPTHCTE